MINYQINNVPYLDPFWVFNNEAAEHNTLIACGKGIPSVCILIPNRDSGERFYFPRWSDMSCDPYLPDTIEVTKCFSTHVLKMLESLNVMHVMTSEVNTIKELIEHPHRILISDDVWGCSFLRPDRRTSAMDPQVEHYRTDVSMVARAEARLDAYVLRMPIPWMAVTYTRQGEVIYREHFLLENKDVLDNQDLEMCRVWGDWLGQVYERSVLVTRYILAANAS